MNGKTQTKTCRVCGESLPSDATKCEHCFSSLEESQSAHDNADFEATAGICNGEIELWNPAAAANWSLVFTPIFGSALQMKNWKALGHENEAQKGLFWLIGYAIMLAVSLFTNVIPDWTFLAFLVVWYFAYANKQIKHVKTDLEGKYARKPWKKPLLSGLVGLMAVLLIYGLTPGQPDVTDLAGTWRVDIDANLERQLAKAEKKPSEAEISLAKNMLKTQLGDMVFTIDGNIISSRIDPAIPPIPTAFELVENGSDYLVLKTDKGKTMKFVFHTWDQIELIEDGKTEGLILSLVEE